MPSHSAAERQVLADTLAQAGPGAPTLCSGWNTTDLAVHLVVREGRPHVRLGGAIGPLKTWANRQQQETADRPYADLVETIRNGPPAHSPLGLPGVDDRANLMEHFVHCEDVRRAVPDWQPRELPGARQAAFWKAISGAFGKLMVRRAAMPVRLQVPGGDPVVLKSRGAGDGVILAGEPGELAMYLFGRKEHARVQVLGDDDAVARFRNTPMRT